MLILSLFAKLRVVAPLEVTSRYHPADKLKFIGHGKRKKVGREYTRPTSGEFKIEV